MTTKTRKPLFVQCTRPGTYDACWVIPKDNPVWNLPAPSGDLEADQLTFEHKTRGNSWHASCYSIRGLVMTIDGKLFGMRCLTDIKQDGYSCFGRVSVGGKMYRAFTTSALFRREDGALISAGVLMLTRTWEIEHDAKTHGGSINERLTYMRNRKQDLDSGLTGGSRDGIARDVYDVIVKWITEQGMEANQLVLDYFGHHFWRCCADDCEPCGEHHETSIDPNPECTCCQGTGLETWQHRLGQMRLFYRKGSPKKQASTPATTSQNA